MQKAGIKGDGYSTGRSYEARNLVQIGGIKREKKNPEKGTRGCGVVFSRQ